MNDYIIKNVNLVNEGIIKTVDVAIKGNLIAKIAPIISEPALKEIDGTGKHLIPGIIDDQVHFREPGLTHKANIQSEAAAAVAGGVTSFMEMPNTKPIADTQELLQDKYEIAKKVSLANYSFFMGATNENLEEVLKTDGENVCGVKIFMGSSTGNMLVDAPQILENLFKNVPLLIATHCEDEKTIKLNLKKAMQLYGEKIPIAEHPIIRNEKGCYLSSSLAVELAKKHDTRLHILHISTEKELELFRNDIPLEEKKITAEVCVHHLWFNSNDYKTLGSQIKCNPAIKEQKNQIALLNALKEDKLDVVATDHAPHTWEEKQNPYLSAPSGVPLIQHSLVMMLEMYHQGKINLETLVRKMCHAPADLFKIKNRGYVREGYAADLVLFDLNKPWTVSKRNVYYKCNWSPFEGKEFKSCVEKTFVNGHLAFNKGIFNHNQKGERLSFYTR